MKWKKRIFLAVVLYFIWIWKRHQISLIRTKASKERKLITGTSKTVSISVKEETNKDESHIFQGFSPDGKVFFLIEVKVLKSKKLMEGSVFIVLNRIQHCLRAKRQMDPNETQLRVGPILIRYHNATNVQIYLEENNHGMSGNITFVARVNGGIEEAYYVRMAGTSAHVQDINQTSHCGWWSGTISLSSETINFNRFPGVKEKSYGIFPIPSLSPFNLASNFVLRKVMSIFLDFVPSNKFPQVNLTRSFALFDDFWSLYTSLELADGSPDYRFAVTQSFGDEEGQIYEINNGGHLINYAIGTRQPHRADVFVEGEAVQIQSQYVTMRFTPLCPLYARENNRDGISGESFKVDEVDKGDTINNSNVYMLCQIELGDKTALGILHHLSIGPNLPSGLVHILDTK